MATGKNGPCDHYPLHWHAWHNNYQELDKLLQEKQHNVEAIDPRGRTPLHLAVVLGHLESTRVLLRHGANANAENAAYWTVVHEAVATGDPELVQLCLQFRDYQRYTTRTEGVPALLDKLKQAPDFYVEMKWEFTSWVPLVSRVCPSDTYKVWKQGSNVRIDTTLLGFDNMSWQRGSRSYIFKGQDSSTVNMEVDHDAHRVYSEALHLGPAPPDPSFLTPGEDIVAARLTAPISTTYIDTEKISFQRSKSGIWGWRSDKAEVVNSHSCKVFAASNVELVTKCRTEHMTEQDKKTMKKSASRGPMNPLESILGMAEKEERARSNNTNGEISNISYNPCSIRPEEYFNPSVSLGDRDIGRPKEQSTKTQRFKAQLWLAEEYPLSLPEQVIPIIDLMAVSNAHFRKLKDFITLQLPSGFPVKIEIPLFHVLNARITFGNIFALDSPVEGVTCIKDTPSPSPTIHTPATTPTTAPQTSNLYCRGGKADTQQSTTLHPVSTGDGIQATTSYQEPVSDFTAETSGKTKSSKNRPICIVDEEIFEPPKTYSVIGTVDDSLPAIGVTHPGGGYTRRRLLDEDDDILQFALQQSLLDSGGSGTSTNDELVEQGSTIGGVYYEKDEEDRALQLALAQSLLNSQSEQDIGTITPSDFDSGMVISPPLVDPPTQTALDLALEMSRQESEDRARREREEDEQLQAILKLSLTEK